MKKSFLPLLFGAVIISCSSDNAEIPSIQDSPKAISFSTSVSKLSTRSVTTVNTLNEFSLNTYLVQDDDTYKYMDAETVVRNEGIWNTSASYLWPRSGSMTFYSLSPTNLQSSMPASEDFLTSPATFTYTSSSNPEKQEDVLYAVNVVDCATAYTGAANAATVPVNFRHALSQIVFRAQNLNPNWILDVADVKIVNVVSSGTYELPRATTASSASSDEIVTGKWNLDTELFTYTTKFPEIKSVGSTPTNLTTSENGSLLVLPQKLTAWDPLTDPNCAKKTAYFLVRCKIQAIVDADNSVLLWPSTSTNTYADVAIPFSANWEEGKKYVYTFIFNESAGFIPPSDTDAGQSVVPGSATLTKINYSVTVDDFVSPGGNYNNIDM